MSNPPFLKDLYDKYFRFCWSYCPCCDLERAINNRSESLMLCTSIKLNSLHLGCSLKAIMYYWIFHVILPWHMKIWYPLGLSSAFFTASAGIVCSRKCHIPPLRPWHPTCPCYTLGKPICFSGSLPAPLALGSHSAFLLQSLIRVM